MVSIKPGHTERFTPSLIDRVMDLDPAAAEEGVEDVDANWARLVRALRRDLQWLLNTRQHYAESSLVHYPEAQQSLMTYGLPEFDGLSPKSPTSVHRLKQAVEEAIRRFEPRLVNVRVVVTPSSEISRVVHFRVEGFVQASPRPRRLVFDTAVDFDRVECMIQEEL